MQYSYQYNIKILGVPQVDRIESSEESISICLKLFKEIGAKVDEKDIDIAHRTANRNQQGNPSPIICKFVRRIAKESVMSKRKGLSDVDLSKLVTYDQSSFTSIRLAIFDHLTPMQSQFLGRQKRFKGKIILPTVGQKIKKFWWNKLRLVKLLKLRARMISNDF